MRYRSSRPPSGAAGVVLGITPAGRESTIKLPRSLTAATTVCTSQRCALTVLRGAGLVPYGPQGGESIRDASPLRHSPTGSSYVRIDR